MLNFFSILMQLIITICFDLIIFTIMFYFLLEWTGTHIHHPIRQAIFHYAKPLIDPIHKIFPIYRNVDTGLLLLLIILELIKISLLFFSVWQFPNLALLFVWSIFLIIKTFLNFYFFLILFRLLLGWILPIYSNHPFFQLLFILTEPILRPIRKQVAPIKGFDWTPIAAIMGLKITAMLIGYGLVLLGAPRLIL